MATAVQTNGDEEAQPLLNPEAFVNSPTLSRVERAMGQAFKSVADLANLLPTGTMFAFRLLAPIFTNGGICDKVYRSLTLALLSLFTLSCIMLTFTDSFKDDHGIVRYVFATCKGVWVIDGSPPPPPQTAATYKIKFIDFLHAFMSVVVFWAVALLDKSVVSCLYPIPSTEASEILTTVPIGIGVFCTLLFVTFPTVRHGIGFPVEPHK